MVRFSALTISSTVTSIFFLSPISAERLFSFEEVQLSPNSASIFVTGSPLNSSRCKNFPGDAAWPVESLWKAFNNSINGALIQTIPIGASCYQGSYYDAPKCSYVSAQWSNSSLHMADPTSMMSPLWQGLTCQPTSNATINSSCTLGGYPAYAINATTVKQIQLGVQFARAMDIRLVVKNTGHDFSGKSGGAGSLSIWTHHLKDRTFIPHYEDDSVNGYKGPAFKAGSGVQVWEIYAAAHKQGLVVVGGEGRTVGAMGGYIQGGGHSPLSSIYGIAADQILSISLVLPNSTFITASNNQNSNLFWALCGGGGSTFGIVTSVTIKAYPDFTNGITTTSFVFGGPGSNLSTETAWSGIKAYFSHFIDFSDAGTYSYFYVMPSIPPTFMMAPFFAPNMSIASTQALLKPWLDELSALNIKLTPNLNQYSNFHDAWESNFPQELIGRDSGLTGSRLFPRSNWQDPSLFSKTFTAFRQSIEMGLLSICFNFAPRRQDRGPDDTNAVNPAWRQTVLHAIQAVGWESGASDNVIRAQRQLLTDRQEAWRAVSPGAGSYLGESDREEKGWQQSFYGVHYERLLGVKREVDPSDMMWAKGAVGSERWDVQSSGPIGNENGKLCRV